MSTLGEMRRLGQQLTLYCEPGEGAPCHHRTTPSIEQLIQYFGVDFDIVDRRAEFLGRFVCQKCGRRFASLRLSPGDDVHGVDTGQGHRSTSPYVSIEEATRRHHEFMAERRRLGLKSIEELNAESRAKLQAKKRAEKAGAFFIGPPSPWAHRKKGRWL